MRYTQLTETNVQQMLAAVGVEHVAQLFTGIPPTARLDRPLNLPPALTEQQLLQEINRLAANNRTTDEMTCFLGGGMYDHFIPTVVDALASQSEFVTAYTPYQAEASQGALQAFYEYQTLICQLTGMDVSNASLYEGATAAAEAVLMARATNGRSRVLLSEAIHPHTRAVLATYVRDLPIELITISARAGLTDTEALQAAVDERTCCVLVQSPNVFGCVERIDVFSNIAHAAQAAMIASVDPLSCGLLKTPGTLGVDIVVGDAQPLGIPLCFGGPSAGFMACRESFMRKMPGRLVGATVDRIGRRAFCLTLQTREQHIRRERATSNICTNQGLLALRVAIYLCAVGRQGLARVASLCLNKAHTAARRIAELPGYAMRFPDAPFFKEFVIRSDKPVSSVLEHCHAEGILAGVPLGQWFPTCNDCLLIAVTEKRTEQEVDALVSALKDA